MRPFKTLSLAIVAMMLFGDLAKAQDQNYNDCIMKVSSSWAEPCDKCEYYKETYKRSFDETYQITLKNICSEAVELKVAMQEKDGNWRTFPVKMLTPDEEMTAYACHGSGKYLYWVRRFNDREVLLPSDREIVTNYRD